jgi:serine/threonine protein kinase
MDGKDPKPQTLNPKPYPQVAVLSTDGDDHGIPVTLLRETALLKALKHPNVVKLLEQVVRGPRIYLIFELCNCNLKTYLDERRGGTQTSNPRLDHGL